MMDVRTESMFGRFMWLHGYTGLVCWAPGLSEKEFKVCFKGTQALRILCTGLGWWPLIFPWKKTMTRRVPAKPVALLWQWGVCGVVWCIYSDTALMEKPPFKEMGSKPGPQWGLVWSCYCGGGFCNNCIIKHFTKRVMNSGKEWGLYILFKQRKLLSALAAKHDPQLGGTEANIRETIKAES